MFCKLISILSHQLKLFGHCMLCLYDGIWERRRDMLLDHQISTNIVLVDIAVAVVFFIIAFDGWFE